VEPSGVHEHGGEERQEITDGVGEEAAGDKSPLHDKRITSGQFKEEEQNVQGNQNISDHREGSPRTIIITDWEHGIYLLELHDSLAPDHQRLKDDNSRGVPLLVA
jgi:hypothetical protein